jgi:hypothetical protein
MDEDKKKDDENAKAGMSKVEAGPEKKLEEKKKIVTGPPTKLPPGFPNAFNGRGAAGSARFTWSEKAGCWIAYMRFPEGKTAEQNSRSIVQILKSNGLVPKSASARIDGRAIYISP